MLLLELFTAPDPNTWEYDDQGKVIDVSFYVGDNRFSVHGEAERTNKFIGAFNPTPYQEILNKLNSRGIGEVWEFEFTDETYDEPGGLQVKRTGKFERGKEKGKQFEVFANVIAIMQNVIKRKNIEAIFFSAKKEEQSRVNLYARMVKMFANRGGWNVSISDSPNKTVEFFVLWK